LDPDAILAVIMKTMTLIVLAVLLALSGCSREIESEAASAAAGGITLAMATTTEASSAAMTYSTYLYSERDVDVFSRLGSGDFFEQGVLVDAIHVEVGARVTAGQLLATLEDDMAQLELEAAQATADEAQANFARIEELSQRELVPMAEYDEALYAMRYAEAELKRVKLDLSRTRVRAPFAGVVAKRYVRVGEMIEGGTPLFRVTAMAPLRARLFVPESQGDVFHSGAPVRVTGVSGASGSARVIVVGPTVDPGSATREVIIELSEPGDFRPGATVAVEPTEIREIEN
jgi:membrane fusion protein (multidrug efflux system)